MSLKNSYKRPLLFSGICLAIAAWVLTSCATVDKTQPPPEKIMPANIEAIKVSSSEGDSTVVEITTDKSTPYTSFKLVDPNRIILDIRGVPGSGLPKVTHVNDLNVTNIHVEEGKAQAATTRVVVTLAKEGEYNIAGINENIILTLLPKMAPVETVMQHESEAFQETKAVQEPRIFFEPGSTSLNQVLGVDYIEMGQGKSRLTVTTDKKASYNLDRKGPKTLALIIEETTIPPLLLRNLDSSHFNGAVDEVTPVFSSADDRLSLEISLREMVPLHVDQTDSDIHIDFGSTVIEPPEKKIMPVKLAKSEEKPFKGIDVAQVKLAAADQPSDLRAPTAASEGNIPGLKKGKYRGPNMTMDFANAEVTNILRLIGEVSNLNVIWGSDVKGKVSMRLKDVPWEQALELVLANNNLGKREEGNIIWVAPKTKIVQLEREEKKKRAEAEEERKRKLKEEKDRQKEKKELEPLITEYIRVDFADASADIKPHIDPLKTKRGSISVDTRTNTIIMTDIASVIKEAKNIVREFDTPVKQIMIEARIVDASTNLGRDLGVRWGNTATGAAGLEFQQRNDPGVAFGMPTDSTTYAQDSDRLYGGSFSTNSPDNWAPNIGVSFGKLSSSALGAFNLNADLALAESEGKATIISAPKVIASNGETATISRGTTFYLPAAENVEAKEVNADLSLTVTPTVSFNDYVSMEISVTDESADGLTKSGKDITTKLMVKSGETIVIGGIYTEDTRKNDSGIPWLRNVPVVGWLFNAETNTESKTELLIFITPRVLPPPMSKTL